MTVIGMDVGDLEASIRDAQRNSDVMVKARPDQQKNPVSRKKTHRLGAQRHTNSRDAELNPSKDETLSDDLVSYFETWMTRHESQQPETRLFGGDDDEMFGGEADDMFVLEEEGDQDDTTMTFSSMPDDDDQARHPLQILLDLEATAKATFGTTTNGGGHI